MQENVVFSINTIVLSFLISASGVRNKKGSYVL